MVSQCLESPEARILDASQIAGPDQLADILSFLGMDEDECVAALSAPFSQPSQPDSATNYIGAPSSIVRSASSAGPARSTAA